MKVKIYDVNGKKDNSGHVEITKNIKIIENCRLNQMSLFDFNNNSYMYDEKNIFFGNYKKENSENSGCLFKPINWWNKQKL